MTRYRIVVALTSLFLAFVPLHCHPDQIRQAPNPWRLACGRPALEGRASSFLYSSRVIRRAKVILQMQLLELREERLERARAAVLRRITIAQLLDPHPASGPKLGGLVPSNLKQRQANDTTTCL